MEHEVVGQLAKKDSASSEYLHVFVKLSDVSSVSLDTETPTPLTFDLSDAPSTSLSPRSALTHSLVTSKPVHPSPSHDRSDIYLLAIIVLPLSLAMSIHATNFKQ